MKTRTRSTRYQPVLELPPLSADEEAGLRASISLHGVLVPILLAEDGRIIDGNNRKRIAGELGYDCPESTVTDMTEEEIRALARSLNLARRHLTQVQRRQLIADQLEETPDWSNRRVAKALGVSHPNVATVRAEMVANRKIYQFEKTTGLDGKARPSSQQPPKHVHRPPDERRRRIASVTLLHGECRDLLPTLASASVDMVFADPVYPEISREYGRMTEADWLDMMRVVVRECRRVLKPNGSMVVVIQPNYDTLGRMRLWPWEFLLWAAKEWNLVQDVYWFAPDALPSAGTDRKAGLLKTSVKWCVWLGSPTCYRNQEAVLAPPSDQTTTRNRPEQQRAGPSGRTRRCGRFERTALERGGSVPPNCVIVPKGGGSPGSEGHPAVTPIALADWWVRYLLPPAGVLLSPFAGSGTELLCGLDHGASSVIGIEREERYIEIARRRVERG
jgi:DNA modification methylase